MKKVKFWNVACFYSIKRKGEKLDTLFVLLFLFISFYKKTFQLKDFQMKIHF